MVRAGEIMAHFYVECLSCGAEGPVFELEEGGMDRALRAWNDAPRQPRSKGHMTNGDKIRALPDRELVKAFSTSAYCEADKPTQCPLTEWDGELTPCEICKLKWLQQEAKENESSEM